MYQPSIKTPKKVFQKGGFCKPKVWFLQGKKGVFTRQKYGFCIAPPIFLKKTNRGFRKTKTPIPLKETKFLLIHKLYFLIHIVYTRLQFNYFLLHFA